MSDEEKVRAAFGEALARSAPDERNRYLTEIGARDPNLRRQVDSLLLAHDNAHGFLRQNALSNVAVGEGPGSSIGRYKLLQQIGEGGFGVVFMAEQQEPVRRFVALKIIKAGMDTREVVARFEAERQALALMDHPNIARVLDGGATDSGRPYFVMDLVKGIPITDFCEKHRLPTETRLRLFIQVCAALQHAHQKGVIHRDLKPSNVLVTLHDGAPVPKVIDFGISKAIGQRLTDKTLFTRYEQLIGTPAYMSPEQAEWSGLDIDTRSDVYSLGVLLYELLTGTTPLEKDLLARAAFDEVRRLIRETEPPNPSTRLTALVAADVKQPPNSGLPDPSSETAAASRRQRLQDVRGDLDWIVMKSLEKDRNRRYETVGALARDIERLLEGEPVLACPPSAGYRARKFVRKHRIAVGVVGVVAISVLAGLVLALIGFAQARRASQHAQEQAEIAKAVNDFLLNDLLGQASPENSPNADIKLREVLERASEQIKDRFTNQPLAEASIRHTLGKTFRFLHKYDSAEAHARRATELRTRQLGADHPDTLTAMSGVALLLSDREKFAEASTLYKQIVEASSRTLGAEDLTTLRYRYFLADSYRESGRLDEADAALRVLLEKECQLSGSEHWRSLQIMHSLATVNRSLGRFTEAIALNEAVLGVERPFTNNWHVPGVILQLAIDHRIVGNYERAADLLSQEIENVRRRWGPDSDLAWGYTGELIDVYGAMGAWSSCLRYCQEMTKVRVDLESLNAFDLKGAVAALLAGDTNAYHHFALDLVARFGTTTNSDWARVVGEVCFLLPDSVPDLTSAFRLAESLPSRGTEWDRIAKKAGRRTGRTRWQSRSSNWSGGNGFSAAPRPAKPATFRR